MSSRELIAPIYLKNGRAVRGLADDTVLSEDAAALCADCENRGADALIIFDLSDDAGHEEALRIIRQISRAADIPIYGGGHICRLEDVKKLIYAGCRKVFLNYAKEGNRTLTAEASSRFGRERILACVRSEEELQQAAAAAGLLCGVILPDLLLLSQAVTAFSLPEESGKPQEEASVRSVPCIYSEVNRFEPRSAAALLAEGYAAGLFCSDFTDPDFSFMEAKYALKEEGIPMNTWEADLSWEEIKKDSRGLLPVVVQDYRTLEVLMVAYMNEEAYRETLRTGRMTYWSRSREELWVKGLTSGHFQYVRELAIDCDNDTLLAKVRQIGAACHTGNRSCFYRTIMQREYNKANPMKVFEDVYAVIEDRKAHPKEGSYTNYLFDKGIDKILKKVGEEAAEIIIAAKNPDPDEVVYEISDFLYHVMVLMCERGLTWEDITEELAKR